MERISFTKDDVSQEQIDCFNDRLFAFKLYTDDFAGGTQYMSNEQVGIYIRLLMEQFRMGYVSKEIMESVCLVGSPNHALMMLKFSVSHPMGYCNRRMIKEREDQIRAAIVRTVKGSKGGTAVKEPRVNPKGGSGLTTTKPRVNPKGGSGLTTGGGSGQPEGYLQLNHSGSGSNSIKEGGMGETILSDYEQYEKAVNEVRTDTAKQKNLMAGLTVSLSEASMNLALDEYLGNVKIHEVKFKSRKDCFIHIRNYLRKCLESDPKRWYIHEMTEKEKADRAWIDRLNAEDREADRLERIRIQSLPDGRKDIDRTLTFDSDEE